MDPKISPLFWSDPEIEALKPEGKLCVLWMLTNPSMNLCGFFQVSAKRFQFETGLEPGVLQSTIKNLPRTFAYYAEKNIVYSRNFIRSQLGYGDQLVKNRIFASLLSVFRSTATHGPLIRALLSDYPEIQEGLENGVGRGLNALLSPSYGGREGAGEGAGEGVSSGEEESEGKPHPPGMPKDKQQAVQWASMQAVPAEYASTVWEQIEGIGFIDGNNRRIVNWRSYISSRYSRQKTVAVEGQKKLSVMDLKSIIQIKEEKAKAIKEKYATEGAVSTDWDNQAKREEWLALRKEIKELKSEIERRA